MHFLTGLVFLFFSSFSLIFGFIQRYLFDKQGKRGIVIALASQLLISTLMFVIIFRLTLQPLMTGEVDGPSGLALGMFFALLALSLSITFVVNMITATVFLIIGDRRNGKQIKYY